MTLNEMIKELRKPGKVFTEVVNGYAEGLLVAVEKGDLIRELQARYKPEDDTGWKIKDGIMSRDVW